MPAANDPHKPATPRIASTCNPRRRNRALTDVGPHEQGWEGAPDRDEAHEEPPSPVIRGLLYGLPISVLLWLGLIAMVKQLL